MAAEHPPSKVLNETFEVFRFQIQNNLMCFYFPRKILFKRLSLDNIKLLKSSSHCHGTINFGKVVDKFPSHICRKSLASQQDKKDIYAQISGPPSPTSFTQLFTIRLYTVVIYEGAVVFAATVVAISTTPSYKLSS